MRVISEKVNGGTKMLILIRFKKGPSWHGIWKDHMGILLFCPLFLVGWCQWRPQGYSNKALIPREAQWGPKLPLLSLRCQSRPSETLGLLPYCDIFGSTLFSLHWSSDKEANWNRNLNKVHQ
jgi:hypothetical protein